MKLARLLPALALACSGSGPLTAANPEDHDGGAPLPDGGAGEGRDDHAACSNVAPIPTFGAARIATVDFILGLPGVAIAADGKARIFFLAGAADQPAIFAADPASGAVRKLSQHGFSFTRPRFLTAPGGDLRGAYEAGDTTLRWLEWSGDISQDATDSVVTPDFVLPSLPAVALDGRGEPVIAAIYDHQVRIATRDGQAWSTETVATNVALAGVTIAMALDSARRPVIAAADEVDGAQDPGVDSIPLGLTVWSRADTSWSRVLADEGHRDVRPRALSTPDGEVALFFSNEGQSPPTLGMAVRRDGAWQVKAPLLDAVGQALPLVDGADFDVAYGPGGLLHVVYSRPWSMEASLRGVGYAVYDGCRWTEVVAAPGDGLDPALALDPAGRPHIVFDSAIASGGAGTAPDMTEVWYAYPLP